ncbi:putative myosin regulatory light chain cdc4 [Basidiobolus meristosporus CBS 931.73]|uniref:Putative myosin regulatory light chain cdc4 n=1 Tax=Basidiobolus meristosporus CBS 931.73 TaxID=1314790 RepID=A0A1Y1ZAN7_9FUNG|nr:putative myosin regulatory light chain cdc4 [Basidiobolus meristosporus CBS 931.73]|eukprot:ORY07328.1 putative myosin regulatory light chain cdc4 [Basidiobolus meristosporus CBS 931.73]
MADISEEQLSEYREAFSLFDKRGDGVCPPESLGELLRALGQNPTQADLQTILDSLNNKPIDFNTFLEILNRPGGFELSGSVEEFIQAFQVFDKDGSGYISAGELRYVLTSLGEKLTENEVDELLKGVETDKEGAINYESFVNMLMTA